MPKSTTLVINYRDLVGLDPRDNTHVFFYPNETTAALMLFLKDPNNHVVIVSDIDAVQNMSNQIRGLALPAAIEARIVYRGIASAAASAAASSSNASPLPISLAVANAEVANPDKQVVILDSSLPDHDISYAHARNIECVLTPIHISEVRPATPFHLMTAISLFKYAPQVRERLRAKTRIQDASVRWRESRPYLLELQETYKDIAELGIKTTLLLTQATEAVERHKKLQNNDPNADKIYTESLRLVNNLTESAALLNVAHIIQQAADLKKQLFEREADRLLQFAKKSLEHFAKLVAETKPVHPDQLEFVNQKLDSCSEVSNNISAKAVIFFYIEVLRLKLLRVKQSHALANRFDKCFIQDQLHAVRNIFQTYSLTHLIDSELAETAKTELNQIKQTIFNFIIANVLQGHARGPLVEELKKDLINPAGSLRTALSNILKMESNAPRNSSNDISDTEAEFLLAIGYIDNIDKAIEIANDKTLVNKSYCVIHAHQLLQKLNELSNPPGNNSIRRLFSRDAKLSEKLFKFFDYVEQACVYFNGLPASQKPPLLGEVNLPDMITEMNRQRLNITKQSRQIKRLYFIRKENTLTASNSDEFYFADVSKNALTKLLSDATALVVFVSEEADSVSLKAFISKQFNQSGIENCALYLGKDFWTIDTKSVAFKHPEAANYEIFVTSSTKSNVSPMPYTAINEDYVKDMQIGDVLITRVPPSNDWKFLQKRDDKAINVKDLLTTEIPVGAVPGLSQIFADIKPEIMPLQLIRQAQWTAINQKLSEHGLKIKTRKSLEAFPVAHVCESVRHLLGTRKIDTVIVDGNFQVTFAASQVGVSTIWVPMAAGAPRPIDDSYLQFMQFNIAALRENPALSPLYDNIIESLKTVDANSEAKKPQETLALLAKRYLTCIVGPGVIDLKEGVAGLSELKANIDKYTKEQYNDVYGDVYSRIKGKLMKAYHEAAQTRNFEVQFLAGVNLIELYIAWASYETRTAQPTPRMIKNANDKLNDLLCGENGKFNIEIPELQKIILACNDYQLLELFLNRLKYFQQALQQPQTRNQFWQPAEESNRVQQLQLIIRLVPIVQARVDQSKPKSTFLSGLLGQ